MIKIQDIQPADILPEGLRDDVSALGIAYAVCRQIEKWCVFNDGIMIYYMIASLPDEILDLMAAEYRTPAYSTKYSTDVKRTLIADTMLYFMKLGTPMAVRRIITSIRPAQLPVPPAALHHARWVRVLALELQSRALV